MSNLGCYWKSRREYGRALTCLKKAAKLEEKALATSIDVANARVSSSHDSVKRSPAISSTKKGMVESSPSINDGTNSMEDSVNRSLRSHESIFIKLWLSIVLRYILTVFKNYYFLFIITIYNFAPGFHFLGGSNGWCSFLVRCVIDGKNEKIEEGGCPLFKNVLVRNSSLSIVPLPSLSSPLTIDATASSSRTSPAA